MTDTKTLGDLLAQTHLDEKSHSLQLAQERADKAGAEQLKRWNLAKAFFEKSRETLTQQIVDRIPTKKLGVLVGQTPSKQENMDIYNMFAWYGKEAVIRETHDVYPLWKEFLDWAYSQKLVPSWDYEHDGVGIHGWYVLRLKLMTVPTPRK